MGVMITTFLTFLLEHADLVNAIWEALDGSPDPAAKKVAILKAIREAQIAATVEAVEADLGPRP